MQETLRIAIAGLGTVGVSVISLIEKHQSLIKKRTGKQLEVVAVNARNKNKDRAIDINKYQWVDTAESLADLENVDVIVELIGGDEGHAKALVEKALMNGKAVVTANKALIATHGTHLAALSQQYNSPLLFEAAVAGGIPVIKTLKEGLVSNDISSVVGILNGTCNYIISAMETTGLPFADILKEAQQLGYAEADPTFDIEGIDAAHKIAIIASLIYGTQVNIDALYTEGITHITLEDIQFAKELGFTIKLLAICQQTKEGLIEAVHPSLIPFDHPLAPINGVDNAVLIQGDGIGKLLLQGPGAGGLPTATAVIADIADVARGNQLLAFNRPATDLVPGNFIGLEHRQTAFYLRLTVEDEAGVLASISDILAAENISVNKVLQKPHNQNGFTTIIMTTHSVEEAVMVKALATIGANPNLRDTPHAIRVLG